MVQYHQVVAKQGLIIRAPAQKTLDVCAMAVYRRTSYGMGSLPALFRNRHFKQSQEIKQLRHLDLRLIIAQGSLVIPITTDVFCRLKEAEKFVCSVKTQKIEFIP